MNTIHVIHVCKYNHTFPATALYIVAIYIRLLISCTRLIINLIVHVQYLVTSCTVNVHVHAHVFCTCIMFNTCVAVWKACPKSIGTSPPLFKSTIKFDKCLSPIPIIYWHILAVARVLMKCDRNKTNASGVADKLRKPRLHYNHKRL